MGISKVIYYSELFYNDFRYISTHVYGPFFEDIKNTCLRVMTIADTIGKVLSTDALLNCEEIDNLTNIKSHIDGSIWAPEVESMYDEHNFGEVLKYKGEKYLGFLDDFKAEFPDIFPKIFEMYDALRYEIAYKNEAKNISYYRADNTDYAIEQLSKERAPEDNIDYALSLNFFEYPEYDD